MLQTKSFSTRLYSVFSVFLLPITGCSALLSRLKVWWETCKTGLDAVSEILEQPSGVYNILYNGYGCLCSQSWGYGGVVVFGLETMVYCWLHTDTHLRLPVDEDERFCLLVKQSHFPNVFAFDLTLLCSVTWRVRICWRKVFGFPCWEALI